MGKNETRDSERWSKGRKRETCAEGSGEPSVNEENRVSSNTVAKGEPIDA
jgi:hypothetical protein